jgi:septin family protein
MDTQRPPRQIPNVQFRVLIIGRANAGKTTILQRVCDTTESPVIYQRGKEKREEVRGPKIFSVSLISLTLPRLSLSRLWMSVLIVLLFGCL